MSLSTITDAIAVYLNTNLSTADQANCAWPNTNYTPDPLTAWLSTQMTAVTRASTGPGTNAVIQWDGRYQVNLFSPLSTGLLTVESRVDAILALFPRGTSLTTSDGHVVRFETPTAMPTQVEVQWVHGIAVLPWFSHEFP